MFVAERDGKTTPKGLQAWVHVAGCLIKLQALGDLVTFGAALAHSQVLEDLEAQRQRRAAQTRQGHCPAGSG
jgi:hypothetical protein